MASRPTSVAGAAKSFVGLALALICTACDAGSRACTLIGATSGVSFGFAEAVKQDRGPFLVTACIDGTCDTRTISTGRRSEFFLDDARLTSGAPVSVSLTVANAGDEKVVFEGDATVDPVKRQPNGPDCPPTVWQARVLTTGDGALQQDNSAYQ